MKDGLVDSQLRTAQLLGTMTHEHPLVRAAQANEQAVEHDLHEELQTAVAGLEVDARMTSGQVTTLQNQLANTKTRLEKLAGLRAEYANLAAETKHKTLLLEAAQRDLAAARSSQASAQAASQITRIDAPNTGTRPVGPSRAMLVLAGLAGGLLTGLGVVLLGLPMPPAPRTQQPLPSSPGLRSDVKTPATVDEPSAAADSFEPAVAWSPEPVAAWSDEVAARGRDGQETVAQLERSGEVALRSGEVASRSPDHAAAQSLSFTQALEKAQARNGNGRR